MKDELLIIHIKKIPFAIFTTRDGECSHTSIKVCKLCEVVVVIVNVLVVVCRCYGLLGSSSFPKLWFGWMWTVRLKTLAMEVNKV